MKGLRTLLTQPGLFNVPGIFDGVSARIADQMGFPILYMTGYGVVASGLGLPDTGLATYTEMVGFIRMLADIVGAPIIADGDAGYGAPENIERTVRGYEAAGAAAIQIEDQCFPKRSAHAAVFHGVASREEATARIRAAVASRRSRDFLVIARTDARRSDGLDEALHRGDLFLRAGADLLFIEGPETYEEVRRIAATFKGTPLVINMVRGGRTPLISSKELAILGYKIALAPVDALLAAAHAIREVYGHLERYGIDDNAGAPMLNLQAMGALMDPPATDISNASRSMASS